MADDRFAFIAEWYDPQAALVRRYQLMFYCIDNTVEMYDIKNRRMFLRRTKLENVTLNDLYIGNSVNVLSRQLTFVDFGDDYTRRKLSSKTEKTLALIKSSALNQLGSIVDMIYSSGFHIAQMKMLHLDSAEARDFMVGMPSGPLLAMELVGTNAVSTWLDLIGPSDPTQARSDAPTSLRAKFGTDSISNAVHGSANAAEAARELEFFFPSSGPARSNTARFGECTCAIIKPHAVSAGNAGKILSAITDQGFEISALCTFNMDKANAEEFFEVYKGVVAEYNQMVIELTSGMCIALEIRGNNVHEEFREFCGPSDPEIARHLRPRSLRAQFGKDKVQNAAHCTDLPEDASLEVQYFFHILDK